MRGLIPAHAGKTCVVRQAHVTPGAHPRSRGENPEFTQAGLTASGSSPLTRGKQSDSWNLPSLGGLIPAHAGKTCSTRHTSHHAGAHPRSRGENFLRGLDGSGRRGSSPLTRGKLAGRIIAEDIPGLIPAHAGKTKPRNLNETPGWAHPRSRGENMPHIVATACAAGSSPLTRGKPRKGRIRPHGIGLIPAHAGKTNTTSRQSPARRAHPRSRGENQVALCVARDV